MPGLPRSSTTRRYGGGTPRYCSARANSYSSINRGSHMSLHRLGNPITRREALCRMGGGFGMMAFASMVGRSLSFAQGVTGAAGAGGAATLDYPQQVKRVI